MQNSREDGPMKLIQQSRHIRIHLKSYYYGIKEIIKLLDFAY